MTNTEKELIKASIPAWIRRNLDYLASVHVSYNTFLKEDLEYKVKAVYGKVGIEIFQPNPEPTARNPKKVGKMVIIRIGEQVNGKKSIKGCTNKSS